MRHLTNWFVVQRFVVVVVFFFYGSRSFFLVHTCKRFCLQITEDLQDILGFLRSEIHILTRTPILTYQQAATYPQHQWVAQQAQRMRQTFDQSDPDNIPTPEGWVEWMNKPQVPEAFELELSGHSKSVLSTCFAKDNRTLLSGSADGTIRVWDSQTGELHAQLEDHQGPVTCVRLSPDGNVVASASADKTIRLWRFPANECFRLVLCKLFSFLPFLASLI